MPPVQPAALAGDKRRSRRANPRQRAQMSQLVLDSIKYLSEHSSWSAKSVAKRIRSDPQASALATACGYTNANILGRRVGTVLKRAVRFGILKRAASRRYSVVGVQRASGGRSGGGAARF